MSFLESKLLIQVKRLSNEISIPKKMYPDSAGYDLYADETVKVCPGGRVLVNVEFTNDNPKRFFWSNFSSIWTCNE